MKSHVHTSVLSGLSISLNEKGAVDADALFAGLVFADGGGFSGTNPGGIVDLKGLFQMMD